MKHPVSSRTGRLSGNRLCAWMFAMGCCLTSSGAVAQDWFMLQGILDAEMYKTDSDSGLLTRNDGNIAALGRLQIWTAFQLSPSVQMYAMGQFEADNFEGYGETGSDLEQLALRYTRQSAPWLMVEAGKILSPLVAYSDRRLSTKNPLIGQPYLYTTGYPWGAKILGSAGRFDYQGALVDPSGDDLGYTAIEPQSAFRPVLALGVTPFTGFRIGLSWTQGPYLNHEINGYLPEGSRWRDFDQRTLGFDFQFSRGYLEFNGQLLLTEHDVPYRDSGGNDNSWYLELKYTWTPRLYGAVRYQRVETTYIGYPEYDYWYASTRSFESLEIGVGYRFSPDVLLKLAYQADHWKEPRDRYSSAARGHAVAMQLSIAFDLVTLFAGDQ